VPPLARQPSNLQTPEAGDEGHLGPQWAQVRPCRGVCPDPWRVLDGAMMSGEVEVLMRKLEVGGEVVEWRRGRADLLGPPVWRRPPLR